MSAVSKRLYIEYLSICKNYHFATCKEGFLPIYCSYLPIYLMRIEMMMKRENSPWSWSLQDWIKRGEEPAFIGIRRVLETGAPCPCLPPHARLQPCRGECQWGMPNFPSCLRAIKEPPSQSKVSSSTAFNKSTPHLYYYYLGMKFLLIWLIVFISHINSFTIN